MSGFKLSTTLFALTNEWLSREYTFESLVAKTVELGFGPGLEIVGFQSVRGYPTLDPEFERSSKDLVERCELEPSCLSTNIDMARRPDRLMTQDEVKESLAAQVGSGRRLGFPVVKAQKIEDDLYPWASDFADKAGVKLGIEIHAPVFVEHPLVVGLREVYDRIDSPALGFVPDWSSTMTALPTGQLRAFERNGLTREQTDFLRELWDRGGAPHELFEEFADKARSEGATEQAINQVRIVFSMFAHNDPRGWLELMPRVVHVHAKFYELEADGTDPSIPHRNSLTSSSRAATRATSRASGRRTPGRTWRTRMGSKWCGATRSSTGSCWPSGPQGHSHERERDPGTLRAQRDRNASPDDLGGHRRVRRPRLRRDRHLAAQARAGDGRRLLDP